MRNRAHPPELAASEVFGHRLRSHLEVLARVLPPHVGRLERRFLERLKRLGFDPRERKALAAVTPGAAAAVLASRRLPPAFIEQVEYNGRRMAKLNLAPGRIVRAFREYDRLLAGLAVGLKPGERDKLERALEQWYFCVVLTLNAASRQVADDETRTCHDLFRGELESGGLDELLGNLLKSLVRFCRAEAGALYLRDRGSGRWSVRAAEYRAPASGALAPGARVQVRAPGRLGVERCSITGPGRRGAALDPAWNGLYRTCWSVPLKRGGELAGVIQFAFSRPYEWLPREVQVLALAAERCLLAAEKAQLVEELAAREAQVRELAGRMFQVEERERRRISNELHDEAGQSLLCVRLQLEILERSVPPGSPALQAGLREARELTERTIVEIRRLISALSPAVLEQLGLAAALRQLAGRLRRLHRVPIRLQVGPLRDLPGRIVIASYRLAQECLSNAVRHSSAAGVNISVASADGRLRLRVEDDGVGFRVEEAFAKRGSYGLAGMLERVSLLGGELRVESRPGRGTRIWINLPLRTEKGSQT